MTNTVIAISSVTAIRSADFVQARELSRWDEAVTPLQCLSPKARENEQAG